MGVLIKTNDVQTPITEELLNKYPDEVREQFLDMVSSVPFIQNLISPNRPEVKDLSRDERGRAIIDITNPPIFRNTDYFRKVALDYMKNDEEYTKLRPNSNPNSEYRKFWEREKGRIYKGCLREEDGLWIPDYFYWELNYVPMLINEIKHGSKRAVRKVAFPLFFDGTLLRFLYINSAIEGGHHGAELAKRGAGKSYSLAAIMSRNLIFGKSEETKKRWPTVLTAYQKEYLKGDKDGTLSKFEPTLAHIFATTPFPHLMLKNSSNEMVWQMGYKNLEGAVDKNSSLNSVMGVSAKDDSDKLRGKRADILFEEFGNFNGLLELYDACRRGTEDGDFAFSTMFLVGTANNKESNFQSAKTLLYAPKAYNIHEVDNVYDKKGQGKEKFAYFYPAYMNRAGCMDEDGNSDVVAALLQILMRRYEAKYGADPTSVLRVIAEDPITPAEAIIKVKDAYFPVQALSERAQVLDFNKNLFDDIYVGELFTNSKGEMDFRPTDDTPIRTYPVDNTTKGALEIFQMPEKNSDGEIFSNRYIIGVDPYDNDQAESSSLYSINVFDLFTDLPVAEYTGRTSYADDAHEMVRKLALFYNAKVMYEANKKGLYAYMEKMHSVYMLADTPEYLRDKQLIKYSGFGSSAKGINVNATLNNYGNSLLKDWLNKLIPVEVKDDQGNSTVTNMPLLYKLKNRALIEELIQYNPEMNFDRIRSMAMVMLYREEFLIRYGVNLNAESRERVNKDYLGNDDFFTKNYNEKFHIGNEMN